MLEIHKIHRESKITAAKIKSLNTLSEQLKCYEVSSKYQPNKHQFTPYKASNNYNPSHKKRDNFITKGIKSNYNKIKRYNPF